jgi:hypothetical protein
MRSSSGDGPHGIEPVCEPRGGRAWPPTVTSSRSHVREHGRGRRWRAGDGLERPNGYGAGETVLAGVRQLTFVTLPTTPAAL